MSTDILSGSDIPGWEIATPPRGPLESTTLSIEEARFGFDSYSDICCLTLSGMGTNNVYVNVSISDPQPLVFRYPVGSREHPIVNFTRLANEVNPDGPISNGSYYARFLRALIDVEGPTRIPNFDKRSATSFMGLTLQLKRTEFPISNTSNLMGQIYLPTEIMK